MALVLTVFLFPGKRLEGQAGAGQIDVSSVGDDAIVLAGRWEVIESSQDPSAMGSYGYASNRLRVRGLDPRRRYDFCCFIAELVTAGLMVFLGGIAFMSAIARRSPSSMWYGLMCLSPRELEVALLTLEGKRNKEKAEPLFVSENTVKTHMAGILPKAGVKARSELFAIFARGDSVR
jgi:DNA-binding CsgD family transcriptional regulator